MTQGEVLLHTFLFLLRVSLFTVTGMVLHRTEATSVLMLCPALWETMAVILTAKCLRVTLCAMAFRLMRETPGRRRGFEPFDLLVHMAFFVIECVVTSRSLNTPDCVRAAGEPFDGHPLLVYVNGISCVWDGCYILACALFVLLNK